MKNLIAKSTRLLWGMFFVLVFLLIVLKCLYLLGEAFDEQFLIRILEGILANIIFAFIALLGIDTFLRLRDSIRLKGLNLMRSQGLNLKLSFIARKILVFFGLMEADPKKMNPGSVDDELWALKRLKEVIDSGELKSSYFEKMKSATPKEIEDFTEKLSEWIMSVYKGLGEVEPFPDPSLVNTSSDMAYMIGGLSSVGVLKAAIEEASEEVEKQGLEKVDERFAPLLVKLASGMHDENLLLFCRNLLVLSGRAEKNSLFLTD